MKNCSCCGFSVTIEEHAFFNGFCLECFYDEN